MPYLFVTAEIVGGICLLTAFLDMGMNGTRYARWAPYGLFMSMAAVGIMWIAG